MTGVPGRTAWASTTANRASAFCWQRRRQRYSGAIRAHQRERGDHHRLSVLGHRRSSHRFCPLPSKRRG